MQHNKISLIVPLIGRYEILVQDFTNLIDQIKEIKSQVEVVFVTDNRQFMSSPLYQMIPILIKGAKLIELKELTDLPAILYNEGIKYASGEYLLFATVKSKKLKEKIELFNNKKKRKQKQDVFFIKQDVSNVLDIEPSTENIYAYLMTTKFLSLDQFIINKNIINDDIKFDENEIVQNQYDRLFMIELSKRYSFELIGEVNTKFIDISYPFNKQYLYSQDIIERYITHTKHHTQDKDKFFVDIKKHSTHNLSKEIEASVEKVKGPKYKITVLGGYWEFHHNQICFFDYFDKLRGSEFCTYRTLFEYKCKPIDLIDSDLVIFTRCKSDNSKLLIDYCNEKGIPSLYMLDDNWMSIGKDYPDLYGEVFKKGNAIFDNFIYNIINTQATLVYSDLIKEDICSYAKDIYKFKIGINQQTFNYTERKKEDDCIYIGFMGSLRFTDSPFIALSKIAKKYKQVKVFLVGVVSDEQKAYFKGIDYIQIPFSDYYRYAKNVKELSPDIVLAPLEDNRSNQSKCYNKYIESGIIRATCIYSKQIPYTEVIEEGVNGFFVEDNSVKSWYDKIEEVILDINKLRQAQENAYQDVISAHTIESNIEEFKSMIVDIIERGRE